MVIGALAVIGLCFGSFVNALVWRLKEKKNWINDRSECINCHHKLSAIDLIPVVSWLLLLGKCRYCRQKISTLYPTIEVLLSLLYVASYVLWPDTIQGINIAIFSLWLITITGLVALALYDFKWMILPTKIIYFLDSVAIIMAVLNIVMANNKTESIISYFLATLIGGGLFYIIFRLSNGRWIGGGDVRLGFLLGLIAATPQKIYLTIFMAAIIGTVISIPFLVIGKLKKSSLIPFGPFLIAAAIIVEFSGSNIIYWYSHMLLGIG